MYKVVESFISINGEGIKAGELALFIRFAGCNLACNYCDTKWANEESVDFTWIDKQKIYKQIKSVGISNVTLTGGEPLMQQGINELINYIAQDEHIQIEIETNGSIDLFEFKRNIHENVTFTMDYKLGCSGMEEHMLTSNFLLLEQKDVVKFVIGDTEELETILRIIRDYSLLDRCTIILSPVFGAINPEKIVEFMRDNRLNEVKLQLQLHKIIWNPERRGV